MRRGDKVRILSERGSTVTGDQRLWYVKGLHNGIAHLVLTGNDLEARDVAVKNLVVVAQFRDFIYPGLVSTGKVERGGDKPFHTVINAENYYALKALS